ncbi:MAG TPA: ATP-binding protein [Acidimicrobiales bacterium]|nr:ATP-binding protein [Acidimicrobiales bacterium]
MCHDAAVRLACTPRSVRAARTFVMDRLRGWGVAPTDVAHGRVADAVLVVSELVGNAVKNCSQEVELRLVTHGDHIEVAVTDDNPEPAELKQPDPLTPGGRGLVLVDAIAEQWGQRRQAGHKTVWARLRVPPGSALATDCRLGAG